MQKKYKSIEEKVEDWAKKQFGNQKYYTKTEFINNEIDEALAKAPSKTGGRGKNFPDIRCLIELNGRRIPVMIEVKGTKGRLIKKDGAGKIDNYNKKGEPLYQNIALYAVNGAVHYCRAILDNAESYKEVIAVGINGYEDELNVIYEISAWYISKDNLFLPKHIGDYDDLSFLKSKNIPDLFNEIDKLGISDAELEEQKLLLENQIEIALKSLNQTLHEEQNIVVSNRVQLVAGMIMAGLGSNSVPPLKVNELVGRNDDEDNDGQIIMRKIKMFLADKHLPSEKIDMIKNVLQVPFLQSNLQEPIEGESKLHTIYQNVKTNIIPYLTGELHNLDFTGRLFNVMNDWVDVPDGDRNDVVLTPRYVTELMTKLCRTNMDSYVWDFAAGSAGFLISAMNTMISDAKDKIRSKSKYEEKVQHIKMEQLLGIEKLPDVYMLAVLNMILMKDGSANIIQGNSLNYDGNYKQGNMNGKPFPANVFLLNPPYSAPGNGFIFVEKALSMMNHGGYAAVLIKENAGSGIGLPYTENILKKNTLLASIKMGDIFCGKASVQTAIYVFKVGEPHNELNKVQFIDFSEDGYTRMNRKKSGQDVNLRDTDHARERYEEITKVVCYGKSYLHYYKDYYVEDTISLKGNDWTYSQHKKINTIPDADDFACVVKDYLSWRVSEIIKQEDCFGKKESTRLMPPSEGGEKEFKLEDLFKSSNGNFDIQKIHLNGKGEVVISSGESNNGVVGRTDIPANVFSANTITVDMFGNSYYQVQPYKMVTHARVFSLSPIKEMRLSEKIGLYILAKIRFFKKKFSYNNMCNWEKVRSLKISLPIDKYGNINFSYIEERVRELEEERVRELEEERVRELEAYLCAAGLSDCSPTLFESNAIKKPHIEK